MNDDNIILTGIEELKSEGAWIYENLKIQEKEDDTLLVRNELFWFGEKETSAEKVNECFKVVLSDFQRLQKNESFQEYANGKKVKVQIFDNSTNMDPLIEKAI